jgi:hypothetical protein
MAPRAKASTHRETSTHDGETPKKQPARTQTHTPHIYTCREPTGREARRDSDVLLSHKNKKTHGRLLGPSGMMPMSVVVVAAAVAVAVAMAMAVAVVLVLHPEELVAQHLLGC